MTLVAAGDRGGSVWPLVLLAVTLVIVMIAGDSADEDDTHACPAARCVVRVASHQLMCRKHWKLVPPALRREVYATWDDGEGRGSEEHIRAMQAAVSVVNERLSER